MAPAETGHHSELLNEQTRGHWLGGVCLLVQFSHVQSASCRTDDFLYQIECTASMCWHTIVRPATCLLQPLGSLMSG